MIDRVLVLLLAGCALFGAVIFVELTSEDAGAATGAPVARRPETGPVPRAQGPGVDELLTTILDRPLFSPTRQPAARKSTDQPTDLDLTDVRLTGIVIEPGRHLAIFAVAGAKPIVRSEGETMNDWRVDSITPGEVVLSGPAGSMTLQPKIDASLVRRGSAPPRPGQVPPPAAAPGAPRAASPAAAAPPARPTGPGIAAPAPPGAAPLNPASMPAVAPPGTPLPPPRMPGAAGGRE
jgi:hypothetical protein